jgi:histidinol-phosphate aminotransferase
MKNIEDYFVPWMKGQKMYISNHLELAWREMELGRMMSNENPNPPSKKVFEAIQKYGRMANRYPDSGTVVRKKIAEINDLDGVDNVLIGNGSCEVFDMIFRCFIQPGEEVVQHTPCFGIYKLRCNVLGGKLVSVPMINKDGLQFDPDAILAAITDKTRMVVIANPNNPTGNFMDREDFIRIAKTGVPFVVDEAYVEFSGLEKSMVQLTKEYKNVMITRTLSKAYGLAGLRFGYMLGHKDVVGQIAATLLPWNVGTIPLWVALASLEDREALAERVKYNKEQVKFIEDSLAAVPGLFVFRSKANYILMDGGASGKKGDDMVKFALSKGLIFRPVAPMYDNDGYFRITLGTEEQNKMAVEAIKEFFTS